MGGIHLDPRLVRMPPLGDGAWLNVARPLESSDLRGGVILIDFWDYSCVNCLRTLPYLRAWHVRYADLGLTIIGVHAPEFRFARHTDIVAQSLRDLDIRYPVLLDEDYITWDRFANRAWPTKHLVDHKGYIRLRRQGEGYYSEVENAIQELLRQRDPQVVLPQLLPPLREEDAPGAVCYRSTPELHAGYQGGGLFGSALGNPEGFVTDGIMMYAVPAAEQRAAGHFYLEGFWRAWPEAVALAGENNGRVLVPYEAAGANAVLAPTADTVELLLNLRPTDQDALVEVRQDGRPLSLSMAGQDIYFDDRGRSLVRVDRPRLYALVRNPAFEAHELELVFLARGLALYTLTFETCLAQGSGPERDVFERR